MPTNLPHDEEAERLALGCVLEAASANEQGAEGAALFAQLSRKLFFGIPQQIAFDILATLNANRLPLTIFAFLDAAKNAPPEVLQQLAFDDLKVSLRTLTNDVFHWTMQFPVALARLQTLASQRAALQWAEELSTAAKEPGFDIEKLRERMGEMTEAAGKAGSAESLIEVITPEEARAYEPDPADFMVGRGLIMRETFVVIGGEPGCGKSRLATTLANAGSLGKGTWQDYEVRTRWRTLILQTENKGNRLKEEFDAIPKTANDFIRVAKNLPKGMAFGDAAFRRELSLFHAKWPFQMLVIDPWNDVCADEGQSDYKEALRLIMSCFRGEKAPAVVIVAHLRKARNDASGRRKTGRELLHELSGSLALGSTARTVFAVQPASPSMDDDRLVFEVAKANDADPNWLKEAKTRTAWHRRNGMFLPCRDFDWNQWDNPAAVNEERRGVTLDQIREVFGQRVGIKRSELVAELCSRFDHGTATVYRAIKLDGDKPGYLAKYLKETPGGLIAFAK